DSLFWRINLITPRAFFLSISHHYAKDPVYDLNHCLYPNHRLVKSYRWMEDFICQLQEQIVEH
ncbi:MAG: hypothetical protein LPH21_13295, partial [Shewanella sp.]|nr:hypothetical protein [Shewanella sp.]